MDIIYQDINLKKHEITALKDLNSLDKNLITHCIPNNINSFESDQYSEFLEQRRKLMAQKIKEFYKSL
ncbi:hypothetical protein [Acinetobacter seifertii]|uniref:hypothetical protein n=1 Tax=Acinetobacter seifertii TaxID=1530123 RepID=UPI00209B9D19|nr:hypothetical protein [Acinetobacter seifertii]